MNESCPKKPENARKVGKSSKIPKKLKKPENCVSFVKKSKQKECQNQINFRKSKKKIVNNQHESNKGHPSNND